MSGRARPGRSSRGNGLDPRPARWTGLVVAALLAACGGAPRAAPDRGRPDEAPARAAVDPGALEMYWRLVAERNERETEPFLALFADPVRCFDGRADVPLDTLRAELGERFLGIEHRPVDVHAETLEDGSVRVLEWVAHVRSWEQPVRVEPRSVRLVRLDDGWRVTAERAVGADCGEGEHLRAAEVPEHVEACIEEAGDACGAGGATQPCWQVLGHCLGAGSGVSEVRAEDGTTGSGPQPAAGDCAPSGWCVVAPANGYWPMRAVAGRDMNDVYAGGRFGLAHFDGSSWSGVDEVDMPIDAALAREDGSLWFVGRGDGGLAFAHVTADGVWTRGPLAPTHWPHARSLHAARDGSVWAFGGPGLALRFDGATWSTSPRLTDRVLEGALPTPAGLLVYGARGTLLSFDGTRWRRESTPGGPTFFASAVVDDEPSLFAVAEPSPVPSLRERVLESTRHVLAPDGTLRARETIPDHIYDAAWAGDALLAVGATGAWRRVDGDWVREPPTGPLRALWTHGASAVAVGDRGAWLRRDGAWTFTGVETVSPVRHIVGNGPDDVYAVSGDAVRRWDGERWRAIGDLPDPLPSRTASLTGDGGLVLTSGPRTATFDGTRWTVREDELDIDLVQRVGDELYAVATVRTGEPPRRRGLYRWRGAEGWEQTSILPDGDVQAILGPTSVYALVDGPEYRRFLVRVDGPRRRVIRELDGTIEAFWARGRSIVLVVDDRTLVFDGRRWRTTARDPDAPYSPREAVVGAAPTELYARSSSGVVRFDGEQWTNVALPRNVSVQTMAMTGAAVWAGASAGVVLRAPTP